jgi:hypothetical protein
MSLVFSSNYYDNKSIWDNTRQILYVWLTPTPYILYNHAINTGNFGFAGVALGLIRAQNIFGISTIMGLGAGILYVAKVPNMHYVNIGIGGLCMYLYGLSISRIIELTRYLPLL